MNNTNTQDLFNFRDYVLFLKDKLDNTEFSEVVGVHGDYGAGKTTTMNIIKQLYKEDKLGYNNILEFSAWRNYYNKEDTVWKALLYELAGKIIDVFEDLDKKEVRFSIQGIGSDSINGDQILKQLEEDGFGKFEIKFNYNKKDFLNNILYDYVKLTCLEIQYNLYQDLKDFDGELRKGKSEIEKHPFIGMGKILLKSITETKDLAELFFSGGFSGIIGKIFSKNNDNNNEESNEKSLLNLFKKEEQELKKIRIDSLEVIQRKFDILLELYNLISFNNKKIKHKPLIIMVDDLDRILPEKSVEIIEILRIFFEKSQKIHFICAIDIRVIEKGIERKFNQLNQGGDLSRIEFEEYLEKIITIPFDLPAIPLIDFDNKNNIFGVDKLIEEKFKDNNLINKIDKSKNNEEKNNIDIINKKYDISFKNGINGILKDIIKTGLQANPRKIKRFIDVFEIYFKILMYRKYKLDNKHFNENEINKYSSFLAKMLIIKLEWDEIYKEFIKDKFYLAFIENIVRKIKENTEDFSISYNLEKFIKKTKKYKFPSLLGMLSIGDTISNEDGDINNTLSNIYIIYYLLPLIDGKKISINENFNILGEFNLLKYLYDNDEGKIDYYLSLDIINNKNNTKKILESYLNYIKYDEIENKTTNINILNNNQKDNG